MAEEKPVKTPTVRSHTFLQECQIADAKEKKEPVIGYEFAGGKRKFHDKVDKAKSYD